MNPGLIFAENVLTRLRRDMERFAPGRLGEMDRCLGRSVQYLRRVSPAHLRLEEAFAAMRFLGFKPAEYLGHMAGGDEDREPRGPLGFFRRHRLKPTHRIRLERLEDFCSWAYGVDIDARQPTDDPSRPDLPVDLGTAVDAETRKSHVLGFADFLLPFLADLTPETIRPGSARGLIETLLQVIEYLPRDRAHVRAGAQLLDVAFYLEAQLDDPSQRHRLFAVGARLSRELGYSHDALWCLGEALDLAVRLQDFAAVAIYREALESLAPDHPLSPSAGPWPAPAPEVLAAGRRDRDHALAILDSSRDTASITAEELDRRLGAKEAFAVARNHGAGMTLARWGSLVHALGQSPAMVLRRISFFDPLPTRMGGFLQGLRPPGKATTEFTFQRSLLAWARRVEIQPDAESQLDFPEGFDKAHLDLYFPSTVDWLEAFCRLLPKQVGAQDAGHLCQMLVGGGHWLGQENRLDEAVDFFDAALHLQDRMAVSPILGFTYRMGSYLAMWLGNLQVSLNFLHRAVTIDLALGTEDNHCFTQYARGSIGFYRGRYEESLLLFQSCLNTVREKKSSLPTWFIYASIASQHLRLGNLRAAQEAIAAVDERIPDDAAPLDRVSFLLTKAEVLSLLHPSDEALEVLDRADRCLDKERHARDLVLIRLERCDHFLRRGRLEDCRSEARSLLRFERNLARYPVGRSAVLALVKRTLVGSVNAADVKLAHNYVAYPFLFRGPSEGT